MRATTVLRCIATALLLACAGVQAAQVIQLKVVELPDKRHVFYTKLLEESLRAAGYEPRLEYLKDIPQTRSWKMVARNELSLIWGVQTTARDRDFASIANPLTNGQVGQRILLVRKGQQQLFAGVRTLDEFRRLGKVGGLGEGWFDVEVWQHNGLPTYVKSGDWRSLFDMLARGGRGVDYMERSITEVVNEAASHPELEIEPYLLLMQERDMRFYLSPETARWKGTLEAALSQADRSGLKKQLIAQYILPDLKALNLDKRLRIKLEIPGP